MFIPSHFNTNGLLDPGTYEATLPELRSSVLVHGDGSSSTWDSGWRRELVRRAELLIKQLWKVGVIYLDGSFVEDKNHPNDVDGYFDPHLFMETEEDMAKFKSLVSNLNNLDPHKVWVWDPQSRRKYRGYSKKQLPMWHFYRVELYPHLAQSSGVTDKEGHCLQFPSAFRQSRATFEPKGIVKICKEVT